MADKPIPFSAPMVRAILAGRKSQTRRILKPQPWEGARYTGVHFSSDEPPTWFFNSPRGPIKVREAYAPGDRLWVRETWRTDPAYDGFPPRDLRNTVPLLFEADDPDRSLDRSLWGRYRHARFMPRWASRITLEATDVRVQRLQEISEEDAIAEGIGDPYLGDGDPPFEEQAVVVSRKMQFRNLWNTIHGPGSWEASPWVAAITFQRAQ
jgi:hypothetical protein